MDWSVIGQEALAYLFTGVATALLAVAGIYVPKLVNLIGDKLGATIDAEQSQLFERMVKKAILAVEEFAAKQFKMEGKVPSSAEKLEMVRNMLQTIAPDLIPDDIDSEIHAALAEMRGVGATGNRAVGVDSNPDKDDTPRQLNEG